MAKDRKTRIPTDAPETGSFGTLGSLLGQRAAPPPPQPIPVEGHGEPKPQPLSRAAGEVGAQRRASEGTASVPSVPRESPPSGELSRCRNVVVRCERKGHGGKTVTLVLGLALEPTRLDALSRRLRQHLGCGGIVAENAIQLQGDQRDRALAWLNEQGARARIG